jgi:hypothetical protein
MTLPRSNTHKASILGFRDNGEVILHFPDNYDRPPQPSGTELLGFDPVDGGPILLYKVSRDLAVSSEASPRKPASFGEKSRARQVSKTQDL